jgi:hypothetical protein
MRIVQPRSACWLSNPINSFPGFSLHLVMVIVRVAA